MSPSRVIPPDAREQALLCFEAIAAALAEAEMGMSDIVRINAYLTDRAHMAAFTAARDSVISDPPPASTLVIVAGLARPEFLVEVEAVAAK